jgi:hypothetical protein
MLVTQNFSEPETNRNRQPYRVRIEGKDGQAFEIVEQLGGGFTLTAVTDLGARLEILPCAANSIMIRAK